MTNLFGDLALADIAKAANLFERHLYRLFEEATGVSPHQHVTKERVKAKALLRKMDLTTAETPLSSGFFHHTLGLNS